MAGNGSGKMVCGACGATSNNVLFARDGVPRWVALSNIPLSDDPVIVKRRNRAARLRRKNG